MAGVGIDALVGYATITVNATRRRVLLPCRRSRQLLPTFGKAAQNDVGPSIVTFNQLRIGNRRQWLTSTCHNEATCVTASSLHYFLGPIERIAYSGQLALRQELCASCLKTWRRSRASTEAGRIGLQNSNRIQRRYKGYVAPEGEQARPITGFYAGWTLTGIASGTRTNKIQTC